MTRSIALAFVGMLSISSLALLASCDSGPGGDGDRWSCATAFAGSAEGIMFEEASSGTFTAIARLRSYPGGVADVEAGPDDLVWAFEGEYVEVDGPLAEDQKVRRFIAIIEEDGSLLAVTEDRNIGSNFALSGSIDLDGDCTAEGTWDFSAGSNGTWEARP